MAEGPDVNAPGRALVYVGWAVMLVGVLLLAGNFFMQGCAVTVPGRVVHAGPSTLGGMVIRIGGGIALLVIGAMLRAAGRRGPARED